MNEPIESNELAQLLVISTHFEIDKEYLRQEARHPKHKEKLVWFFNTLPQKIKENFRKEWYQ